MTSPDPHHVARHFHAAPDGRLVCDVCPRECKLQDEQRGMCFVRKREGDAVVLTTYGRSSGFCVDPIEKKPLAHFYPGSSVLSFGTAGCNLACKFCQNWDISKSREVETLSDAAFPEQIAETAKRLGCRSVAFTYNDPTIFLEYATDVADACHERGIAAVAVTAGYISDAARRDLYAHIDAANVDLKAFTDEFYRKLTASEIEPVKDTLRYLVHETDVWTEITTLLIPGQNDSDEELHALTRFVAEELGPDVPLHFSAFHPDYRMRETPGTPPDTLRRARRIGLQNGLRYVYTGNVHDPEGEVTRCPSCDEAVIARDWYELLAMHVKPDAPATRRGCVDDVGRCARCGTVIPGRFDAGRTRFGRRRLPVRMSA
ncbi:MAG: AmmeMemoRadiSam system radical SAM enzyme [Myxococcales bacterium]|nr:AmmeMemoRadiSam system radical SAM enzyme [Myxococcales bacterium]